MAAASFDLVVIGAGPGGYVAAIKAAQLGLKTALVEKGHVGGTCLNVGCIPSKSLLHSTELHHAARHSAAKHGLILGSIGVDVGAMMKTKDATVVQLRKGVAGLLKKNKVTLLAGAGRLLGGGQVEVSGQDAQVVSAKEIVIATGSSAIELPFLKFDRQKIVSSDEAIAFDHVPARVAVIGAGAIGLELGSVWCRIGSDVTVVEMLPQIAPLFDVDVAEAAQKIFAKQGLKFELCTKCLGYEHRGEEVVLKLEKDGQTSDLVVDKVLVAIGRRPNIDGLGAKEVGLATEPRGQIKVDHHYRTNLPGVRAIGDVTNGPMLAHKAEEEGVAVAELIAGKAGHVNYEVIPGVVYTDPELALLGLTESVAAEQQRAIRVGRFPFMASGRALASDATDGFVKIVADAKSDRLLGAQIVGKGAGELIATVVAHMEYGGSAEDLGRTVFAHPTMAESIKEAALSVNKMAIHAV